MVLNEREREREENRISSSLVRQVIDRVWPMNIQRSRENRNGGGFIHRINVIFLFFFNITICGLSQFVDRVERGLI